MNNSIRVRFAPSPTGYLHVGGLRTALYNYLFARKNKGTFILRIEDTDRTRYIEGAVENLLKTMEMIGLPYDEGPDKDGGFGPYYQSQRTDIYLDHVKKLLDKGAAYHCFCSPETLAEMREKQRLAKEMIRYDGRCRLLEYREVEKRLAAKESHVIRAKIPESGSLEFEDLVRGQVTFPWDMIDDQVLIKSDGYPTYHLANVVDDHLMKISHVIRGEEWLSSTPKHIFLYDAFGWEKPKFAHLPLLLNPDKSKLSKRQGDVAVEDFLAKGYLPEALINFVALLGWHNETDREIFSLMELEETFSIDRITKSGAVFDLEKLQWMNGFYLRNMKLEDLATRLKTYFKLESIDISDQDKYLNVIDFAKERITLLPEIIEQTRMFYEDLSFTDEDHLIIDSENAQKLYSYWLIELSKLDNITEETIEEITKKSSNELNLKGKELYFPLRLALYGKAHGPNIPTLYRLLGKDDFVSRFQKVLINSNTKRF
ncbi:MAG: glutamate--tRNA ligase [Candidatus Cloacimonetes bacterium]|nr:glutamate--tRNA ligase [Candidatus Cloacimonadota bacterium]